MERIEQGLRHELGARHDELVGSHTCVYATGSCGREEMGVGSDLDAYIVRVDGGGLTNADSLEAAVRAANEAAGLPVLDGHGKYLKMVDARDAIELMGTPEDDQRGMLTKRMLLLLESRVLLGQPAHEQLVRQVIDAYWQNENLHRDDYLPFVLVNDIIRYWRIVLLNHESRLRKKKEELEQDENIASKDEEEILLAERRYKSYKLRFPRCLTCFSALTYLLALTPQEDSHVTKQQVHEMVRLTPIDRIRELPRLVDRELGLVDELLTEYGSFLERTAQGKGELLEQLRRERAVQIEVSQAGDRFTKLMFELVSELGGGRPLHRHMLV
ncbi:MAG: hypothetical protein AB1Z98_13835 [Nannocystaceae bacterium]